MKIIVVYQGKTGFTKRYGEWIAKSLNCKAVAYKDMTAADWPDNDLIIYGGAITVGKISKLEKVKAEASSNSKKLIVYAVGATSMNSSSSISKIKSDNLSAAEQNRIPFFYLEGGINYEAMGFLPKMMLKTMYKSLKKKQNKTEEEEQMMLMFEKSSDNSKKEYVESLIDCVNNM